MISGRGEDRIERKAYFAPTKNPNVPSVLRCIYDPTATYICSITSFSGGR